METQVYILISFMYFEAVPTGACSWEWWPELAALLTVVGSVLRIHWLLCHTGENQISAWVSATFKGCVCGQPEINKHFYKGSIRQNTKHDGDSFRITIVDLISLHGGETFLKAPCAFFVSVCFCLVVGGYLTAKPREKQYNNAWP